MVGLISDPIGNPVGEAQGFADVVSQPFQGQEWFAPEKWLSGANDYQAAMYGGAVPGTDQTYAPEARLPAAQLQQRYGLPAAFGVSPLTFTADLPESVAAAMHDAKLAEQQRADAAARAPYGILGAVQRFGASAATQLLDPIGAAAMVVPLGAEAKGASILARAGSALVRGAAAGAAVTTPFVALHKMYADEYGEDYSAGDALRDILMGGALGGGLHALGTVAGDLIGRAFQGSPAQTIVDTEPDIRHAAASEAIAAAIDERPPVSQSVIELPAALKAQADLQRFASYQAGLDDEGAGALAIGDQASAAAGAARDAGDQLASLRDQHQGFLDDIADAQGRLEAANDPVTAERLASIDGELSDNATSAGRRSNLVAERDMLTQGARTTPDQDALAAARTQAELQGLQAGADRVGGQIDQAQATTGVAQAVAASSDRAFRVRAASVEGREALTQGLAERTLRRFAGALKVDLAPDEARGLARAVLREGRSPADVVAAIAGRAEARGSAPGLPALDDAGATARLGSDARGAAADIGTAIARRAAVDHMEPQDAAAIRSATEAAARARRPVMIDDAELAELHDLIRRADEAGALGDDARAELASTIADGEAVRNWIAALPQAAACMLRGIL